jgi:Ca-activated chloride channel family protein
MTDGYVGNESEIIAEIRRNPGARVFGFGIGSSVNRHLMDQMSLQGRGEVEYVGLQDDGSAAARRFHERVRTPLLTDIQLSFDGVEVADLYPRRVPDLFSAKPLVISGVYPNPGRGKLRITGRMGGQPYSRTVDVDLPASASRDGIRSLWARTKVGELIADNAAQHREAITDLGLRHALMTPFTSFVAVEHRTISEAGKLRTIEVPVEMPEGVDAEMSGGVMKHALAAAPLATADVARRIRVAPEALSRNEERKVEPSGPAVEKLAPALQAKLTSKERIGIRIYLRDASAATLAKLKSAGFQLIAQPGGAKLVIGEITGTQLSALLALPEVQHIAPR